MTRLLPILLALSASAPALAQTPPAVLPPAGTTPAPDYADKANWLCRPDAASDTCTARLDAVAYDRNAQRTDRPFAPAPDPKVDCFYVYPTVSTDPALNSDLTPAAGQEGRAALNQAARFRSVCRVFAPMYRQLTMTALRAVAGGATLPPDALDHGPAYDDVKAAWESYLKRDNAGRGVVLIGHSQGAILLKRLIAEEIDGKPAQGRLVSALLAGNVDLTVAAGSDRGGSFRTVPLCRSAEQTGCVVAWSTYFADDAAPKRAFGGNGTRPGLAAACVNPAAPGGGRAALDGFGPRPAFLPDSDPPFVEQAGQLAGECVADAQGNVLRVSVEPGPLAPLLSAGLKQAALPGWGLHIADISLVQGDLIRLVATQSAAFASSTPSSRP